jgi:hypothetical protein
VNSGGGQWLFLAPDALHFAYPSVGIEFGQAKKLVAELLDHISHRQPSAALPSTSTWRSGEKVKV